MKEAIKLAIENGGWEAFGHCAPECVAKATSEVSADGKAVLFKEDGYLEGDIATDNSIYSVAEVILDPAFWQALGKALGWKEDQWFGTAKWYIGIIFREGTEKADAYLISLLS